MNHNKEFISTESITDSQAYLTLWAHIVRQHSSDTLCSRYRVKSLTNYHADRYHPSKLGFNGRELWKVVIHSRHLTQFLGQMVCLSTWRWQNRSHSTSARIGLAGFFRLPHQHHVFKSSSLSPLEAYFQLDLSYFVWFCLSSFRCVQMSPNPSLRRG